MKELEKEYGFEEYQERCYCKNGCRTKNSLYFSRKNQRARANQGQGKGYRTYNVNEVNIMTVKTAMSVKEKKEILRQYLDFIEQGKDIEAIEIMKKVPLTPQEAISIKNLFGLNFLLENNYDLSEAIEYYGEDEFKR